MAAAMLRAQDGGTKPLPDCNIEKGGAQIGCQRLEQRPVGFVALFCFPRGEQEGKLRTPLWRRDCHCRVRRDDDDVCFLIFQNQTEHSSIYLTKIPLGCAGNQPNGEKVSVPGDDGRMSPE